MKSKLFVILSLVLALAMSAFASKTTVTGILTDDMCTKKHMSPGHTNSDCVRECIKHGAKYVVVSEGKVLEVQGTQEQLGPLAGKKVTITGSLKGKVLATSSVDAVQ